MRHRVKRQRLSRNLGQRKALLCALLRSLLLHEQIITTKTRAKIVSSKFEKLITLTKKPSLHKRRQAFKILRDHRLVKKLFSDITQRYAEVDSGFTRILNFGVRKGDGSTLAVLELTRRKEKEKRKKKAKEKESREKQEMPRKEIPKKEEPPKGFRQAVRRIFKKERDAL